MAQIKEVRCLLGDRLVGKNVSDASLVITGPVTVQRGSRAMQRNHTVFFLALMLSLFCLPVHAASLAITTHFDDPELVGKARLKVMFWDVFDASLYADSGHYRDTEPFALTLRYLRSLDGEKIVAKSMEEIKRQAPDTRPEQLSLWEQQLSRIIPDVSKGTSITGVRTEEGYTLFYFGDTAIGSIDDSAFTYAFFNIWLGSKASDPKLRYKLLGGERDT